VRRHRRIPGRFSKKHRGDVRLSPDEKMDAPIGTQFNAQVIGGEGQILRKSGNLDAEPRGKNEAQTQKFFHHASIVGEFLLQ